MLIAFDRDSSAIAESKKRLSAVSDRITYVHANFSMMKQELKKLGIEKVDGILLDLGYFNVIGRSDNHAFFLQLRNRNQRGRNQYKQV